VTELEDKATRRAQRREQKKTSTGDAEGTPETDAPSAAQKQPKAATASEPAPQNEPIRDRNARLRAQAAEERRAKRAREQPAVAVPIGLDASERMDDLFVRTTHAAATWLRNNFRWLQWVVIIAVTVSFGVLVNRYLSKSKAAKSSDALAVGLVAEGATIRPASTDDPKSINPELEQVDPRPVYDSEQARVAAAEQGYRKAVSAYGKSGAGWLARLGLAGLLYDQQKWDEALEQYRAVRSSEIAKIDAEILGRSLEGIGLSLEGKGDRDGALQAFRELTNQEGAPSLGTLGLYHQARILLAQGNKEKAKELATKAKERLDKEAKDANKDKTTRPGFIAESVKILLARIDPAAAASDANRMIRDSLGDDPAKLQRLIDGLKNRPAPSGPGDEQ
jgi:tetratricopeptide (TPR) repeat protein